jgi:hypothetical protein
MQAHLCETFAMKSARYLNQHGLQVMHMQQVMTAFMAAVATIWVVYFWSTSPWLAIAGALVCLFGYTAILALEFAAMVLINRSDASPQSSHLEVLRAWWSDTCHVAKIFYWRQPFRANDVPDQLHGEHLFGQRGVVFIHGLMCNRGFWTPWLKHFESEGGHQNRHAFTAISLVPVFSSIDGYVDQIERAVVNVTWASGMPPILVGHSMGGLVARAWLNRQTESFRVQHVVTIGTPHYGTWLARFANGLSGRQMREGSEWLLQLEEGCPNSGTEHQSEKTSVPGSDLFTCWYSNCDNMVFPASNAKLIGADNRFVSGAAHLQLAFLPEVMKTTLDMIMKHPKSDGTRQEM